MLIYNSKAGGGKQVSGLLRRLMGLQKRKPVGNFTPQEKVEHALQSLKRLNIDSVVEATQAAGHATELAKRAVHEGYDLVIVMGGDGTINEAVNGLAGSDVTLGVIPHGTANVFALEMNLPIEVEAACRVIASSQRRQIDLGLVNSRYFICMLGVGFDAHVLKKADSKLKGIYGALAYIFVGVMELFIYRFRHIELKLDDQPLTRKGYYAMVLNGRYYGGKLVLAPNANSSDGYLDVCIFKDKNIFHLFRYLLGFWEENNPPLEVEHFQCKQIEILKKGRHAIHVDAEYLGRTPARIRVAPKALWVAC